MSQDVFHVPSPEMRSLYELLVQMFNEAELRQFAGSLRSADDISAELPGQGASLVQVTWAFTHLLRRYNLINRSLQRQLEEVRPERKQEIGYVFSCFVMKPEVPERSAVDRGKLTTLPRVFLLASDKAELYQRALQIYLENSGIAVVDRSTAWQLSSHSTHHTLGILMDALLGAEVCIILFTEEDQYDTIASVANYAFLCGLSVSACYERFLLVKLGRPRLTPHLEALAGIDVAVLDNSSASLAQLLNRLRRLGIACKAEVVTTTELPFPGMKPTTAKANLASVAFLERVRSWFLVPSLGPSLRNVVMAKVNTRVRVSIRCNEMLDRPVLAHWLPGDASPKISVFSRILAQNSLYEKDIEVVGPPGNHIFELLGGVDEAGAMRRHAYASLLVVE